MEYSEEYEMRTCSIKECEAKHVANGYCRKHYQQIWKCGSILERTMYTPNDFVIDGDICRIGLYNLKGTLVGYTIIDAEDAEKCKQFKWRLQGPYACNDLIYLHHLILDCAPVKGKHADHINGNSLDNRKINLRMCSCSENSSNRGKQENNKSGYKGVCWNKLINKWYVQIRKNSKVYYLGVFDDKDEAAKVWNKKAVELHGEFAYQNVIKPVLRRRKL